MSYQDTTREMNEQRMQIFKLRESIRQMQASIEPQPVEDYIFATKDGDVRLSDLFGSRDVLFVVHNMGMSCSYCTLWADGLNGVAAHLQDRAAFVVSSPDTPEMQAEFAGSRGWTFPMVSLPEGSRFAADMGYKSDNGHEPGVSVFKKQDGRIVRVSDTAFGPGDDFCAVWHLFGMIPEGADGWQPQYAYS